MRKVELAFSKDCTGSMYPCTAQVKQRIRETTSRLSRDIPGIRIGAILHGDYCDRYLTYVTKNHPLSTDAQSLCRFVSSAQQTNGGDSPECYELVLHEARSLGWSAESAKVFVLIGDEVPHEVSYPENSLRLDWRNELKLLAQLGVTVHAVQALGKRHATPFYREVAERTGGHYLTLDQFSVVPDLLMAIAYQQAGDDQFARFEEEVARTGRMNRGLDNAFRTLSGRASKPPRFSSTRALESVDPWRFQVLTVDRDQPIRTFVENNGLIFKKGQGFYEFTKTETIQEGKEVVLVDRGTGDMFSGDKARAMIGAPAGSRVRVKPSPEVTNQYAIFVQSTSYNRVLKGGTRFLYEVDLSR